MQHKTRSPVAVTATGLREIYNSLDKDLDSPAAHNYQAEFIARKFHLTPLRSRIVCDLAGIGGRAR